MPKLPPRKRVEPFTEPRPVPRRVSKDYEPQHCYSDGKGGVWTHRGRSADCRKPECVQWHREQQRDRPPLLPPWGYEDHSQDRFDRSLTPPAADALCPETGGEHRWQWGDDDNGHSGDVCECGAYQPG